MREKGKTGQQLPGELVKLRRKLARLEAAETRRRNAEASLELELNKFQAFYDVALAMTSDHSLEENLSRVVSKARELLSGDASYIALRDDQAGDVYMHTLSGVRTEAFKTLRVPFGAGLGGKIATTGMGCIVEDYFRETGPLFHDEVRAEGLVSGVAVPIQIGQRNLGVLYVFNRAETAFTETQLATLSLLGNLAAIEIARSQTRAELQEAHDHLEHRITERTIEIQESNEQLKQEITQRTLAEDALRESEEKYRLVVENAHEGIFIAAEGKFRFLNPRIVDIIGHFPEDLLSKPFTTFIHQDDAEMVLQRHYRRLRGDAVPSRYPFRMVDRDGNIKWVEIDSALMTWEGKPAALGFMTDITERRRLEEELSQHRHHLKEMVDKRTAELELANKQLLLEMAEREKTEAALAQSERHLRHLSAQLLTAQEKERKRVARELHDGIGQSLTAIKFRLENTIGQIIDSTADKKALQAIIPVIQNAIEEVRRISMDLRPSTLDDLGILATIAWFCREFQTTFSSVTIEKDIDVVETDVPEPLKIVIFRVLQEALNNIAKHSKASLVQVGLHKSHGALQLFVKDNGAGFDVTKALSGGEARRGLGLAGMRERTGHSGGSFHVETHVAEGTVIGASWPEGRGRAIGR